MFADQTQIVNHLKITIDEKMQNFKSGITQWSVWAHLFHSDFKDGLVQSLKVSAEGIDAAHPAALRDIIALVDRTTASNMRQSYDKHKIEDYGSLGERLSEILQEILKIQRLQPEYFAGIDVRRIFPEVGRATQDIAVLSKRALDAYYAANAGRMALP